MGWDIWDDGTKLVGQIPKFWNTGFCTKFKLAIPTLHANCMD